MPEPSPAYLLLVLCSQHSINIELFTVRACRASFSVLILAGISQHIVTTELLRAPYF